MAVAVVLLIRFVANPIVKTGILDLIPITENTPVTQAAYNALTHALEGRIVILVAAPKKREAIRGADTIAARLNQQKDLFSSVTCRVDDRAQKAFFDTFFPARWSILSPENRARVLANKSQPFVDNAIQRLYAMISGVPSSLIAEDPFFLFEDYLSSLPRAAGDFTLEDNHLVLEGEQMSWVLLSATGKKGVFSGTGAVTMVSAVDGIIEKVRQTQPLHDVVWTGMARYGAEASSLAQREISIIGTGSLFGVILLLLLAFADVRELVYGVIPIAAGLVLAIVATVIVFGYVHLITLVFGASLVGVCIDYSFHYFAHRLENGAGQDTLSKVLPGITLGMITSVVGYIALLVAPFPGLQQMAIFSAVGLVGAYSTVLCLFPCLPFSTRLRRLPRAWQWVQRFVDAFSPRYFALAIVAAIPFAAAIPFLHADDDVRLLRGEFPVLEAEERIISDKSGGFDKSRFVVLWASTEEALAQKEEQLLTRLTHLKSLGKIGDCFSASQLVPSLKVQRENRAFMIRLAKSAAAAKLYGHMGWEAADRNALLHRINSAPLLKFGDIPQLNITALFSRLRLGRVGKDVASVVLLRDITDPMAIQRTIADIGQTRYIDKVATVSSVFTSYRHIASILVALAYAVILVFLMFRYGVKRGGRIIAPPMLTALIMLGGMSMLQIHVNIFTFLALIIVLAIGIDYTLFFAESDETGPTGFAIALSGITTMLSFGLLALSRNPALKTFGGTLLVGILLAVVLSPLSRTLEENEK
ncbi:MAG: hypothetical protein JXX14_22650 [Deltaproteobacteria bacterium]|nr:hypothetical protein [Deltaproteobacteria bacterium]